MVVSCHVKEISCTKGGRLALHQVLAGKLCFKSILFIIILGTTIKQTVNGVQIPHGVVVTHTLERILFFDLGVAVTEINTKKV